MYANITGETPIAALTVSQFVDLLDKHKSAPAAPIAPARNYTQGYAYVVDVAKALELFDEHTKG